MEKLSTIDVAQDIGVAFYQFGNGEMKKRFKNSRITARMRQNKKTRDEW